MEECTYQLFVILLEEMYRILVTLVCRCHGSDNGKLNITSGSSFNSDGIDVVITQIRGTHSLPLKHSLRLIPESVTGFCLSRMQNHAKIVLTSTIS